VFLLAITSPVCQVSHARNEFVNGIKVCSIEPFLKRSQFPIVYVLQVYHPPHGHHLRQGGNTIEN